MPTEDPAALVAAARRLHRGAEHSASCAHCRNHWPCLTERLARALEATPAPQHPPLVWVKAEARPQPDGSVTVSVPPGTHLLIKEVQP